MATFSIDMSELEGIADVLDATGDHGAAIAHGAVMAVGAQVHSQAKAAAPTERPWLSTEGIRRKTWQDGTGSHTDIFTVPDDKGRPVGMFREYGTSVLPPHPFLTIQAPWAESALPAAIMAKVEVFR